MTLRPPTTPTPAAVPSAATDPATDGAALPDAAEPGRRERKRQQQLDRLADTAWTLFETEGYDTVTMERIAAVADVAKGTLYKYFPVKEALLRHRFHRGLRLGWADNLAQLQSLPPGEPRLRRFFALSAAWSEQHRDYLLPYVRFRLQEHHAQLDEQQRSGLDRIYSTLLADGQAAGVFRSDIPTATLSTYLEFLNLAVLLRWLTGAVPSLAEEYDTMLDLVLGGLTLPAEPAA